MTAKANKPIIVTLGQDLSDTLEAAGADTIEVYGLKVESDLKMLDFADGIILTGGGDVNPLLYDTYVHANAYGIDEARDTFELAAIKYAQKHGLPMLGICRGAQLLNVAHGGSLIQDLSSMDMDTEIRHWGGAWGHPVRVHLDSGLFKAVRSTLIDGISFHHQAIDRPGRGLRIVAWAPDGTPEAIESTRGPYILGTQFHPEMDSDTEESSQDIFNYWVWRVAQSMGLKKFTRRRFEYRFSQPDRAIVRHSHTTMWGDEYDEEYETWWRENQRYAIVGGGVDDEYESGRWADRDLDAAVRKAMSERQTELNFGGHSEGGCGLPDCMVHGITDRMAAAPAKKKRKRKRKRPVKRDFSSYAPSNSNRGGRG